MNQLTCDVLSFILDKEVISHIDIAHCFKRVSRSELNNALDFLYDQALITVCNPMGATLKDPTARIAPQRGATAFIKGYHANVSTEITVKELQEAANILYGNLPSSYALVFPVGVETIGIYDIALERIVDDYESPEQFIKVAGEYEDGLAFFEGDLEELRGHLEAVALLRNLGIEVNFAWEV